MWGARLCSSTTGGSHRRARPGPRFGSAEARRRFGREGGGRSSVPTLESAPGPAQDDFANAAARPDGAATTGWHSFAPRGEGKREDEAQLQPEQERKGEARAPAGTSRGPAEEAPAFDATKGW